MTEDNAAPAAPAEPKRMKPIWYFCGWMLLVIGAILLVSGIINMVSPPQVEPVLYELHTDLWWGGVILVGGAVLLLVNRKGTG